jgi:hypothetical protein
MNEVIYSRVTKAEMRSEWGLGHGGCLPGDMPASSTRISGITRNSTEHKTRIADRFSHENRDPVAKCRNCPVEVDVMYLPGRAREHFPGSRLDNYQKNEEINERQLLCRFSQSLLTNGGMQWFFLHPFFEWP